MSEKTTIFALSLNSMDRLIDIQKPVTVCKASAGTGKTFTLAAYYVGLLLSGEDYRSILAITFTNKATAEMSERIIGYLHGIWQGEEEAFLDRARAFMLRDADAPREVLAERAGECFRRMLLDYDNVHIMTIDSFLQTLLSGLAGVLHMNAGFNTELDVDHVIREAVDQLLTTDLTAADKHIIEDYMLLKLDEESQWDVRQSLCEMAKEMYNESVQMLDADGLICFDASAIARRREALEQAWPANPHLRELREWMAHCSPDNYNRNTLAAYKRLIASLDDPESVAVKDRFRGVTEKSCNADEMLRASEIAARVKNAYNTYRLTVRFSRDLELMASLRSLINRNLAEANCALLARTAGTLSDALREGDADFILEKAGIRYHHILMDEFQDTSRLQWRVIHQLLRDILAGAGNTLLVVGDIKQSIYRWRNGDWHIMDDLTRAGNDLTDGRINPLFTSLTRNFRSSEEVVRFNLSLFRHIIEHQGAEERIYGEGFDPGRLEQFYQAKKKAGGYVRFRAIPNATKEDLANGMFASMENLLARGARPSDMMVLVREKREAAFITAMHSSLDPAAFPCLGQSKIVSADSFLLDASADVRTVIAGLRCAVQEDPVAAKYVEIHTARPDIIARIREQVNSRTPLYEAVSELLRLLLTSDDGRYHGTETAYIANLLDRTRAYVSSYGSDINEFLAYWEDTMHAKPISASAANAIRILTVHASKGLQSQTLFIPFCSWTKEASRHPQKIWCRTAPELQAGEDFVPIQDGAEMSESAYRAEYEEEHLNMRVDNLNMLYVALTRAEDNLFVTTSYPVNKDGKTGACNHVGRYIMDYLSADDYEAGEPVIKTGQRPDGVQSTDRSADRVMEAELWADSGQVRFVQSQEGALYTDCGEEAYRRVARMEQGVLCHEIFAHLRKADELDQVLDEFMSKGQIKDEAQRTGLRSLIAAAWNGSPEMRDWFTSPWELRLEEAIYIDHTELRPDRVMINPETGEAVVLDYKFGNWEDRYIRQVNQYKQALRRMGYAPVRGYLWFAQKNKLVEVYDGK